MEVGIKYSFLYIFSYDAKYAPNRIKICPKFVTTAENQCKLDNIKVLALKCTNVLFL